MDAEDHLLAKKLDEEMNNVMIIEVERQPTKKKQNVFSSKILNYSLQNFLTRQMKCSKSNFLKI